MPYSGILIAISGSYLDRWINRTQMISCKITTEHLVERYYRLPPCFLSNTGCQRQLALYSLLNIWWGKVCNGGKLLCSFPPTRLNVSNTVAQHISQGTITHHKILYSFWSYKKKSGVFYGGQAGFHLKEYRSITEIIGCYEMYWKLSLTVGAQLHGPCSFL